MKDLSDGGIVEVPRKFQYDILDRFSPGWFEGYLREGKYPVTRYNECPLCAVYRYADIAECTGCPFEQFSKGPISGCISWSDMYYGDVSFILGRDIIKVSCNADLDSLKNYYKFLLRTIIWK